MAVDWVAISEDLKLILFVLRRIIPQAYGRSESVPMAFDVVCYAIRATESHVEYHAIKIATSIYGRTASVEASGVGDRSKISQILPI